jgi:hypothetical protein
VDRYEQYAHDAEVLGQIGEALSRQDTKLSVRLPQDLADLALAAWQRDEGASRGAETAEQRTARHRAGNLALIGLCIENTGRPEGTVVLCDLDDSYIGGALEAAHEQNLL